MPENKKEHDCTISISTDRSVGVNLENGLSIGVIVGLVTSFNINTIPNPSTKPQGLQQIKEESVTRY